MSDSAHAIIDRTIQYAQTDRFASPNYLTPEHLDTLAEGCVQNGDIPTLDLVERARRAWPDAQDSVYRILTEGYQVHRNDAPRIV